MYAYVYKPLFVFLGKYEHYDGIIWPEIWDKAANQSFITKAINWWKGKSSTSTEESANSHGGNVKFFTSKDHMEFRKSALTFYLHDFIKYFNEITGRNNLVHLIEVVQAVYASINSNYLFYDKDEHDWVSEEVIEVHIKA